MPELNANWVVLIFGAIAGVQFYKPARRRGATRSQAVLEAVLTSLYLMAASLVWLMMLDRFRLSWLSIAGWLIGAGIALVATVALLAFKSRWRRRGSLA